MNKPNLFIIGAPKCGTTALAINLSQHKDIFLPKQKEPRYFDRSTFYDYKEDYFTKTLEEYLKYYDDDNISGIKYKMDGSVFNMYSMDSIENILKLSPNSKFIVVLRDPVEASISMFNQRLSYSDSTKREVYEDFNKCWNLLEDREKGNGYPKGCRNKFLFRYDLLYSYENYIPKLKERLGDNLFIGFYDEYKNNSDLFFKKLFKFLEIENIQIENKRINKSAIVKKSILLDFLHFMAKKTMPIRKKLGLLGILDIQKNIVSMYKEPVDKTIKADKKVYDFFQSTYEYMETLKND